MENILSTDDKDTIVAVATAPGSGGIAVIRLSGPQAFPIADKVWKGKRLSEVRPNTAVYGTIVNPLTGEPIDDGLATPFKGPHSFTGEDTVEFGVHGSRWIQREVVKVLIDAGARMADHGEFTRKAFANGKLDLAQAEGIADLIASSSRAAHRLALTQTRGGFSKRLEELRQKLIDFASLLELELDFAEEDVEFADRSRLQELAEDTLHTVRKLADSYAAGRVLKEGVPVVIVGTPNAGKSTLLNAILGDDKAIVSDIPGTTRDIIEDTAEINGILFRFIDTAGLRETDDKVECLGITRAGERMANAAIIIRLLDATAPLAPQLASIAAAVRHQDTPTPTPTRSINNPTILTVLNKTDLSSETPEDPNMIPISAKTGEGLPRLIAKLTETAEPQTEADLTVTNARHYEALTRAAESLTRARDALATTLSADFIAQDIREAIHHLGSITGAITTADLLQTIFTRFCIGK